MANPGEYAIQLDYERRMQSITRTHLGGNLPSDPDLPSCVSDAYKRMLPLWAACRDVKAGTRAVQRNADAYLSRYEVEPDRDFIARSRSAALVNYFGRTIAACTGVAFKRPPTLQDADEAALARAENIDNGGTHLDVFLRRLLSQGMTDGLVGILSDFANAPEPRDRDIAMKRRYRPYWTRYTVDNIISAIPFVSASGEVLPEQLVLRDIKQVRKGKFGSFSLTGYRVLIAQGTTIGFQIWEPPKDTPDDPPALVREGIIKNQTRIPFSLFLAGPEMGFYEAIPPLLDLCDLNIDHWSVLTGRRNLMNLAFIPQFYRKGYRPKVDLATGQEIREDTPIGPRVAHNIPTTEGEIGYVSPDVSVLTPSLEDLTRLETQMGALGMSFLSPDTRAAETAAARRIDTAAEHGSLAVTVRGLEDCGEQALEFDAEYLQQDSAPGLEMNQDYEELTADPALITALNQAVMANNFPPSAFLHVTKRIRLLPDDMSVEDAKREILQVVKDLETRAKSEPHPENA